MRPGPVQRVQCGACRQGRRADDLDSGEGALHSGAMAFDLDALLALWTSPLPADEEAAASRFREFYHDPVTVNGSQLTAADLVDSGPRGAGDAGGRRERRTGLVRSG